MLQVRLESGRYIPELEAREQQSENLLSSFSCAGKSSTEIETLIGQVIKDLAGEMRCERGASVRVALLNIDKDFNKLLLLLHGAIVDKRGLVLILEDLYRIYEQLANGKEISLRPLRKSYMEFAKEAVAVRHPEFNAPLIGGKFMHVHHESVIPAIDRRSKTDRRKSAAVTIVLDKKLKRRLFSQRVTAFELAPVEAFAGAALRTLAEPIQRESISVWIKSDYRLTVETFKYTAGAMTRTYLLPNNLAEEQEPFSNIGNLRRILRDIPLHSLTQNSSQSASQFSKSLNADHHMLLNLEYLTDEPWLGGDEWLPEGFIITEGEKFTGMHVIEIVPFLLSDRIEIFVGYKETPEISEMVDKITSTLVFELENILRYCEGYVDAKEFWMREFAKATPQAKIEVERDGEIETDRGSASLACGVDKSIMGRALHNFETDAPQLLLAAYSVLVSRLKGSEDLILLYNLDQDGLSTVFPLRLNPMWDSSFKFFLEEVNEKLRWTVALGQYGFDIINEEQPKHGRPYPVLDVGYVYQKTSGRKSIDRSANGRLASHPLAGQKLDLALEIIEHQGKLEINFVYEKSRFSIEIIKRFGRYLNSIMEDVSATANIKLGDIKFERDQKIYDTANLLAADAFNF